MSKPNIAVIFGSRSSEHDISIITAIVSIIKPLERSNKYNVIPVYIAKNGIWYSDQKLKDISLYSSGEVDSYLDKIKPVSIAFEKQGFSLVKLGLKNQKIKIDIVFPATHGTYGEDGSLMGLLRMANVPFVGCDLSASAIAMDKVLSKQIAEQAKIPVAKWMWFSKHELETNERSVLKQIDKLNYPLFVKPAHLGSSIGITMVKRKEDLKNALEVAVHYDDKALVEEAVNNLIEVTVPIIGNENPKPMLVERPVKITEEGVFDFETKYIGNGGKKGGAKAPEGAKQGAQGYSELPAKIPKSLYDKSEQTAIDVYKTIGCSGIARVDLLIDDKSKIVYFNEINPLPGSLYMHNFHAAGISAVQLVEDLVDLALDRYKEQQSINTTFSTNFLKQF